MEAPTQGYEGTVPDDVLAQAFAVLFRTSSLGLSVVDPKFRYAGVNDAWCNMLGYSRTELLATTFLAVTHPDDRETDAVLSRRLFSGELPFFEVEKRWVRRDGSILHGRLLASILHKHGQAPWGVAVVEATSSTNDAVALERTRSDTLKNAGLAHDLNNLLLVIQGNASLLRAEVGDSVRLETIEHAVQRATILSRGVLAAARSGLDSATSSVPDVVDSLGTLLHGLLPADIALQCDLSDLGSADVRVPIASVRLDQVLMNLVVNARDAMPRGGTIGMRVRTDDGFVRISVRDAGEGIPSDVRDRIFEPFFTTKSSERGTGMGLAIVRSILESVGGWIEVESKTGRGTTMTVCLPRL